MLYLLILSKRYAHGWECLRAHTRKTKIYCTKFIIASIKDFRLVRAIQECTPVLFHRKKKEQSQKCKEKILLKTFYLSLEHVSMLAREHLSTQGTLALEHSRPIDT